jgi:hypothetical protein
MSGWLPGDPNARAGAPARAVVWMGGQATTYLRAGCGAVVVLLMVDYDGPAALELIALLSTVHLVIAPSVPSGVAIASWLANLMDGLGISTARVVAEPVFVDDVRRLARDDEGRVQDVRELGLKGS